MDGDAIGAPIEFHLLNDDVIAAQQWSRTISNAIAEMTQLIHENSQCRLIYAGGDELLVFTELEDVEGLAVELSEGFLQRTGHRLSYGHGNTPRVALIALRQAKSARWMRNEG